MQYFLGYFRSGVLRKNPNLEVAQRDLLYSAYANATHACS